MTKRVFIRLPLALFAGLCMAQGGDVFVVESITSLGNDRFDVKLKNPRTGYVHSITLTGGEIRFGVGDKVRETRSGRDIRVDPVGGGSARPPTPPQPQPVRISGKATHRVWSAPWWPDQPGPDNLYAAEGPLELFGRLTGDDGPLVLEKEWHSRPPADKAGWTGHCDGFSISSCLYGEPRRTVIVSRAGSSPVSFQPGDIKGLLAAIWSGFDWQDTGRTAGGPKGLAAFDFHRFVLFYIKENRLPLVVNTRRDAVWNYPCDEFSMEAKPDGPDRWRVTAKLLLANFGTQRFTGKRVKEYVLSYRLTGDPRDSKLVRSADWISRDRPGWVFCPLLGRNSAGVWARPSSATSRRHSFADADFEALVVAMARVAAGEISEARAGGYTVKPGR